MWLHKHFHVYRYHCISYHQCLNPPNHTHNIISYRSICTLETQNKNQIILSGHHPFYPPDQPNRSTHLTAQRHRCQLVISEVVASSCREMPLYPRVWLTPGQNKTMAQWKNKNNTDSVYNHNFMSDFKRSWRKKGSNSTSLLIKIHWHDQWFLIQ